ncbi:hypothetical protein [Amphritea sp. HPY]|uniref:hypothetical protein n=1 Tax=Amphritea sp. HPY TaxID=3421652 RepID=UPI003D7CF19E
MNTNNTTTTTNDINLSQQMSGDMDDALSMHLNVRPVHEDLLRLSEELVTELNPKRLTPLQTKKALESMNMVIANLYLCYQHWKLLGSVYGHIPWLSYSRNKNKYLIASRYKASDITYRTVIEKTVTPLIQAGLLYEVPGFFNSATGSGRQGRLGFEGFRLMSTFEDVFVSSQLRKQPAVELLPDSEVLILKNHEGDLVDYADTPATIAQRSFIVEANTFLTSQSITLNGQQLAPLRMRRIYNQNSWKLGGRLYEHAWQNLPKIVRAQLQSNGSEMIERDYSGLHMNMAYAMVTGAVCPSYPYDYTAYGLDLALFKPLMKVATLIVYNCDNVNKAMRAINMKIRELPAELRKQVSGKKVLKMIQEKHQAISNLFCSGFGLALQYADSQLTSSILGQCMRDGVVALPVHDSYIVPVEHDDYIKGLMGDVFMQKYRCEIGVE